jgi:hypothetical protein
MGAIVFCFGVVDEADIIGDFIEYHLRIGVDAFVATDVGSTDGTLDILSRYERSGRLHLTRFQDPAANAERGAWQTAMVAMARERYEAEWCLFGDPDEFWVMPGNDARAYLATAPSPVVIFPRYNMVPHWDSGLNRIADFHTFDLVARRPLEFLYDLSHYDTPRGLEQLRCGYAPDILRFVAPKAAARAETIRSVTGGCHDVTSVDPTTPRHRELKGYMAHFPVRSLTQWRRKAELVARFMEMNPPNSAPFSRHWVRLALLQQNGLIDDEFARQVLGHNDIIQRLSEGVLERDGTMARLFGELMSESR